MTRSALAVCCSLVMWVVAIAAPADTSGELPDSPLEILKLSNSPFFKSSDYRSGELKFSKEGEDFWFTKSMSHETVQVRDGKVVKGDPPKDIQLYIDYIVSSYLNDGESQHLPTDFSFKYRVETILRYGPLAEGRSSSGVRLVGLDSNGSEASRNLGVYCRGEFKSTARNLESELLSCLGGRRIQTGTTASPGGGK